MGRFILAFLYNYPVLNKESAYNAIMNVHESVGGQCHISWQSGYQMSLKKSDIVCSAFSGTIPNLQCVKVSFQTKGFTKIEVIQ